MERHRKSPEAMGGAPAASRDVQAGNQDSVRAKKWTGHAVKRVRVKGIIYF